MTNKLDSFNKDKVKCAKCKEYFDKYNYEYTCPFCPKCYEKWTIYFWEKFPEGQSNAVGRYEEIYYKFINEQ